jgi:hypothetical protein
MHCPGCSGTNIHRSRRNGLFDELRALLGLWPYRCYRCQKRFSLPLRALPLRQTSAFKDAADVAFRTHDLKPVAQVVVRADSHEQLDQILITLGNALASYNKTAHTEARRR